MKRPTRATMLLVACAAALGVVAPGRAQTGYRPSATNLASPEWFQDARFGLFVHWGVYSVLGDGEWVMNNRRIPIADYEKLPAQFNPVAFDAAEWVALAKAAGMKYITITSKHHDGFAMFDSKVSDYKSTRELIHYLVRAAGSNANFLLNVGPMPNGRIQPEFVTRLQGVGAWLAKNGEAIYGTRGGPIAPHAWGVTTRKGNRVYVHVLEAPDRVLLLPPLGGKVRGARFVGTSRAAEFSEHDFGVVLKLPADAVDPIDTIVALDLAS